MFTDLSIIEDRIHDDHYNFLVEFVQDVTKVFDNCRYYNGTDSPFYHCAEVLETMFVSRLKMLRQKV